MTIELSDEEADLLMDGLAGELARCLMAGIDNNAKARDKYERLVALGQRLGMEL